MSTEAIREALREIESAEGRLTPEAVIERARDREHPLHDAFEWDNDAAAHKWRLEQARELIRSVKVTIAITEEAVRTTVAYVRDPAAGQAQGYRSLVALRGDRDGGDAREVILEEFARAAAALRRARDIAVVLGRGPEIEALVATVTSVRDKFAGDTMAPA